MIHYQLRCDQDHQFDGWYKDSAAFDKLVQARLVDCPVCGSQKVGKALMAPAVGRARAMAERSEPMPPPAAVPQQAAAGPLPAQMLALLQRMRAEVEKNCDYVGKDFAEEARRMHRGESDRRGIFGEANPGDAEALRDEGIEVAQLPWVPRADG
jgi:hypothetical protein